jgi:hypothetical protein
MASGNRELDALVAFFQAKYGEAFTQWLWEEGTPLLDWLQAHPGATDAEVTAALFDRLPPALRQEALAQLRAHQRKDPGQ